MRLFVFKQNVRNFLHLPTTQVKTRQKYHLRLVRKNQLLLIIFNYTIGFFPILVCANYGTSLQIIPKTTQIWRYLELNPTIVCIFCTLGKFGQRNEQIWVNMVIVMNEFPLFCSSRQKEMHKFVAKFGGYCPKLGKNMVGLYLKTYNQVKNVSVIS